MSVGIETLFTSALGLQLPWVVEGVKLDTAKRRLDFEVSCQGAALSCPGCGACAQPVHDRLRRSWRHLDFFRFEARLQCDVPCTACASCGKTTQAPVLWAQPGSGFTAAVEALALALYRELPVRQAASLLRCSDKQLWLRIGFYVKQARAVESFAGVRTVGIDETSLRRGQNYITVVHDLDAKQLMFATEESDHQTAVDFAADLEAHGGDPADVRHGGSMDMSAAYTKGDALALPQAQISYDRLHVIAMTTEAMDLLRRAEMREYAPAVRLALGGNDGKMLKQLMWGHAAQPVGLEPDADQCHALAAALHTQERLGLGLKIALQAVYAAARGRNNPEQSSADQRGWLSWARRSRLEPFLKLAFTIKERFDAVVRGMVDHRGNAYVEAMNGLLQQAKRAARGFCTAANFIAIA